MPLRRLTITALASLVLATAASAFAAAPAGPPDLLGIYRAVPAGVAVAGGRRDQGSPADVKATPAFASANGQIDPYKECLPIGPFRMMAAEGLRFEIVPKGGEIVVIFEDLPHGYMRDIHLDRAGRPDALATWQGQSVGRWEGGTLVVVTDRFNDRTWLNSNGVRHSDALRLVERIRPLENGDLLEYTATAEDAKALQQPYTYRRYFRKTDAPLVDDPCELQYGE